MYVTSCTGGETDKCVKCITADQSLQLSTLHVSWFIDLYNGSINSLPHKWCVTTIEMGAGAHGALLGISAFSRC